MVYNVTCDEEFVALIRGATTLDFGTVLEQQQQRTGRQPKRVDEHANEAEADESEVAVAGATDLEVDVQPFLVLIEPAAAEALEDSLAHERVCNSDSNTKETIVQLRSRVLRGEQEHSSRTDKKHHGEGHLDATVADIGDVLSDLIHDAYGYQHDRPEQVGEHELGHVGVLRQATDVQEA